MALFKYLRHLMCIGYTSLFLYKQSKKYCLGFWELQSLARMKYHSISNKTSGYIGFISSLCCRHTYHMNFLGPLSPFWSFPLKAHRFVCDASPSHHATKKAQMNGRKNHWQAYAAFRKRTHLFSTLKKSMQPFSVHGFPLFYSKWGWEVRSM